jgi:serine/threonine protein kinase
VSFRDFKIIKLVGYGAFGEVYSAINIKNDKAYALKVLNKKKLMSKKQLRYAVG